MVNESSPHYIKMDPIHCTWLIGSCRPGMTNIFNPESQYIKSTEILIRVATVNEWVNTDLRGPIPPFPHMFSWRGA